MRKAVLLTMGRSGSSWVCDLLNSHPDVICHYELLKDHDDDSQETKLKLLKEKLDNHHLEAKLSIAKLLLYQLDEEYLKKLIIESEYEFFLMKRNSVERFVSLKLAEQTGTWHLDNMLDEEILSLGIKDILRGKYSLKDLYYRLIDGLKSYWSKWTYRPQKIFIDPEELQTTIDYEVKMDLQLEKWLASKNQKLERLSYENLPLENEELRDQIICECFKIKKEYC